MARYSDDGAHVCLVTCTNGELGEIADVPDLGPPERLRERLGEIRGQELLEACDQLGDIDVRLLGYHDSGMDGEPSNDDPKAFVRQDLEEIAGRIAEILAEVRPQVLITYNAFGFYGHPDHIRAHEAALRAVELAAGAERAHRVQKVYFNAIPRSWLDGSRDLAREAGWEPDEFVSQEEMERIATDDELIGARIDVAAYVDRKFGALEAHRTQLGTTEGFLSIPQDVRGLVMGTEHYVLAETVLPRPEAIETDLFEGVET